jgi:PAS domain S-box-containing protein
MRVAPILPYPPRLAYAVAAAVAALAGALQWLIHPWVGSQVPFLFFLVGLVFAVISLGRGPAVLVLLAGVLNGTLLAPPIGSLVIDSPQDLAAVLVFTLLGLLIVRYGNRLQLTTTRAALAEKRLALAQKNTGVGIFELDFESGTASVSPSMCQMLGRPVMPGEVSLEEWLGALRPDHVAESRRVMEEHLARGEVRYEREQRIELPTGGVRWVLNRVELEATPAGVLKVARGAAVDITERKQVDELLKRAQAGLQQQLQDLGRLHGFSQRLVAAGDDLPAALQGLLDIMVELYGTPHGVVSLRNPESDALHVVAQAGFDEAAIERMPPAGSSGMGDAILQSHRGLAAQAALHGLHCMPLMGAKGEVMGAISVMFPEPREQSEREKRLGEVCATTAAAVVERERARAAAEKNEQRFSVALESSVVPFSILTPVRERDGRIGDFVWTYLNPSAAEALGREISELLGNGIGAVLPGAWEVPGLFERYVTVVESGEQCEFEIQTAATNQGVRWYNVVAAPLQGSVAVWFANITGRKRHEEDLQDADRRKDDFLATLAHELRNPLAPIRQGVRIAAAGNSTDAQRRWSLAIIERQVQHMSLLLDDLLDVSQIGRGRLLLRKSREPLTSLIETAIETARPHIEAKRHRLEKSLPPSPVVLEIDPVRIAQVLGNLLTNAAKYTDPGGWIHISAGHDAQDFVIRVKDNGIGLSEEQQSQVFEMFSQVPAALERSQGGLGIGLALARGLIALHGGSIVASSAGLGRGTEFCVRLPATCVVSAREGGTGAVTAPPRTGEA